MALKDEITNLIDNCKKHGKNLLNEEQTKQTLILPFIQMLGYNIFSPDDVIPEFNSAMGVKRDARVDYALMKNGKPIVLIECKAYGTKLDSGKCSQLMSYFMATDARVGVLTDGNIYQLYSDLKTPNKMDDEPYIEFSLENFNENALTAIEKLMKDTFDLNVLKTEAQNFKYNRQFKNLLTKQFNNPTGEFAEYFMREVYSGIVTQKLKAKFIPMLKTAMDSWFEERLLERLNQAKQPPMRPGNPAIVTTDMEIKIFYAVMAILSQTVNTDRITINDCKGFCNILLDNKQTKRIARMYSEGENVVAFSTTDENNNEVNYRKISGLKDIFAASDELISVVKRLLGNA